MFDIVWRPFQRGASRKQKCLIQRASSTSLPDISRMQAAQVREGAMVEFVAMIRSCRVLDGLLDPLSDLRSLVEDRNLELN